MYGTESGLSSFKDRSCRERKFSNCSPFGIRTRDPSSERVSIFNNFSFQFNLFLVCDLNKHWVLIVDQTGYSEKSYPRLDWLSIFPIFGMLYWRSEKTFVPVGGPRNNCINFYNGAVSDFPRKCSHKQYFSITELGMLIRCAYLIQQKKEMNELEISNCQG